MPTPSASRELLILEHIDADPDATQAALAEALGVAVGTVNFAMKRLIKKGCLRVKQLERRRLKYIVTPSGLALRTKLAIDSLHYSMRLYRETRARAKQLLADVKQQGYTSIHIQGTGDLADIARLTALELGLEIVPAQPTTRTLFAQGTTLALAPPTSP